MPPSHVYSVYYSSSSRTCIAFTTTASVPGRMLLFPLQERESTSSGHFRNSKQKWAKKEVKTT